MNDLFNKTIATVNRVLHPQKPIVKCIEVRVFVCLSSIVILNNFFFRIKLLSINVLSIQEIARGHIEPVLGGGLVFVSLTRGF